ncbi:RsmE family RNA methyltransferase [uncultured Allofournierella sp.]|uniref:RsmE family RNA methyltransferase n=1 Tax=uncultured Allofournierella sp. TaxID=1940258 RepID=UPI0037517E73
MPHRYFTTLIEGDAARLEGPDAHHLGRVMRAKVGQQVILCDGAGTDYTAAITAIEPQAVEFSILERQPCAAEPSVEVTVFVGYPKQDKLELILQKAVELGAVRIVPFFSRYCVAAPKKEEQKNERYQRIAAEAAKQCGRGILPQVELPLDVAGVCARLSQFDQSFLFYEKGGQALRSCLGSGGRIALITGSEGGFSEQEAQALVEAGATVIGLGQRILRCETAPLAALSAVMTLTGNLE